MLLPTILAHAEVPAPLLMQPWGFALTAAIIFALLGFITFSFRDVANRHSNKVHPPASGGDDHGTGAH